MTIEESLKRILYLSYHLSDVQKHVEALTGIGENNSEDQNHVVLSPMFMTSAPLRLNQKDRINTKVIFSHLSKLFSPSVFFFHQAQNRFATLPVSQIKTKVKEL